LDVSGEKGEVDEAIAHYERALAIILRRGSDKQLGVTLF